MKLFVVLLLLLSLAIATSSRVVEAARVVTAAIFRDDASPLDESKFFFLPASQSPLTGATQLCYGSFNFSYYETGLDVVRLTPTASILVNEPLVARYACGALEAYYTTSVRDGASILDNNYSTTPAQVAAETQQWIRDQIQWMLANYSAAEKRNLTAAAPISSSSTAYAFPNSTNSRVMRLGADGENADLVMRQSVSLQLEYLRGLTDGMNRAIQDQKLASVSRWTLYDTILLNINAELDDIQVAAAAQYATRRPPSSTKEEEEEKHDNVNGGDSPHHHHFRPRARKLLHCSAFVKLIPNDVLVAHNTWGGYSYMYRQLKTLDFETSATFSSYPGIATSVDDFTITSQKLLVTETTNDQDNRKLAREFVVPQTVPYFLRYMAANFAATTAPSWMALFIEQNSGTYNNQMIILDMKLFDQTGKASKPGFFCILEQMPGPGNSALADMTDFINAAGAWYSYNIAYHKRVRDLNRETTYEQYYGDFFSYTRTARARIFEREGLKMRDLETAKKVQWTTTSERTNK